MMVSSSSHSSTSILKTVLQEVGTTSNFGCIRLMSTDDCFIPTNYQKIIARVSALPLAQAHLQLDTVMISVEAQIGGPRPVCLTTSDGRK